MYGAKPENVYAINGWIQVNCDGSHIKDDHPKAEVYRLIVEYTGKPYQGRRFQRVVPSRAPHRASSAAT